MCVANKVKVKAVNPLAPKVYRVSCGECEECRAVYKEAWNFRLTAELEALMNNGWQAGFITLTYSDWMLPVVSPRYLIDLDSDCRLNEVWKDVKHESRFDGRLPRIPCFDREQVANYFVSIRQWLYREYKLSKEFRLRYIACCEYGSHTQRPHMHCLVIFPKFVDARKLFAFMCDAWNFNGFTIPSIDHFEGWVDKKGKEHKGFLIDSYAAAARYAAKYTTKDIYYVEAVDAQLKRYRLKFSDDSRYFRHSLAFHCQSRSLGYSIIGKFETDAQKLDAIKNGVFFVGEDKPRVLPIYIKNKLLYDNKYVYEMVSPSSDELARRVDAEKSGDLPNIFDGESIDERKRLSAQRAYKLAGKLKPKYELGCVAFGEDFPARRLVRREASDFFKRNIKEIFDLKVKKYAEFFAQFADEGCMLTRRLMLCGRSRAFRLSDWVGKPYAVFLGFIRENDISVADVARLYLCYYGVPERVRTFVHPSLYHYLYLNRYMEHSIDLSFNEVTDKERVDGYNEFLRVLFGFLDNCFEWWCRHPKVRSYEERVADCISDEFKSAG